MSAAYEAYLVTHKGGVKEAWDWIQENIPWVLKDLDKDIDWEIQFGHDESKHSKEEYQAYDDYFYGNNKSYAVVQNFKYAWLHHIHNNPHHWQYWVLINDDQDEGTIALEMPIEYVIEMICDWWSFSFKSGDLREIFDWYEKHKERMILHERTRKLVEYILSEIDKKLTEIAEDIHAEIGIDVASEEGYIEHYGIPGMKWGVKNGPPYPLDAATNNKVRRNAEHYYSDKYAKVTKEDLEKHAVEDLKNMKKFDGSEESKQALRLQANADDSDDTKEDKAGRHYNCPNCAMAFEMIERGYAVKARLKKDRSNVGDIESYFKDGKLEAATHDLSYPDPVTYDAKKFKNIPLLDEYAQNKERKKCEQFWHDDLEVAKKAEAQITEKLKSQGEGARGIVVTSWDTRHYYNGYKEPHKKTTAFHAFNYKIENGQVFYYDTQSKREANGDTNTSWIYESDYTDIYTMRTDTLKLNDNVGNAVYSIDEKEWKGR